MMIGPLLILFFYVLPCQGQMVKDSIVHVRAPDVTVNAGKKGLINIYISVQKGYHIQANKVNDEFIIPTTIEVDTREIVTIEKMIFPKSKKFKLEGTTDHLLVYDGDFKIVIPFAMFEKVQQGKYKLKATLHYQACDNKRCYFPDKIVFPIFIEVE